MSVIQSQEAFEKLSQERAAAELRELRYTCTGEFIEVLAKLPAALLATTYQAGQLISVGLHDGQLQLGVHSFELAMGLALGTRQVAVGTRHEVWFLEGAAALAPKLPPAGTYDAALLARRAHVTGNIHGHDLAFAGDELWVVNTSFSCLCTLDKEHSFVPRWKPKFVSTCYEPGDRCHLNGLAIENGAPKFVTALAETDTPNGWRPEKEKTGCLIDVPSGETIARGLCMPHSPRVHGGRLWVLNSGMGQLSTVDPNTGQLSMVANFPGYTRGLSFYGHYAFVGLSRIRETAVFGGLPIAEYRNDLKCGIGLVDLRAGRTVGTLQFHSGVEELFAVQAVPGVRNLAVRGPKPEKDADTVWVVPQPN